MKVKKIEEKIIESIDANDVPSLEEIKNRMDFSKHPFKEKETKETNAKRKMEFGCLVSSLCTLIICLVCMCIVINHNLENSSHIEDVLSKEELQYIMGNYDDVMMEPAFYVKRENNYEIYIYECYNVGNIKAYYYKVHYKNNENILKIYIGNDVKLVTYDNNFGLLISMNYEPSNQKIEFEVEYKGTKKYYCFTN